MAHAHSAGFAEGLFPNGLQDAETCAVTKVFSVVHQRTYQQPATVPE